MKNVQPQKKRKLFLFTEILHLTLIIVFVDGKQTSDDITEFINLGIDKSIMNEMNTVNFHRKKHI
jgi:hypothetical protein